MNIKIETSSYNEKRYGMPWIAKVDFSNNKKGDFHFGDWIGEKGRDGALEIDAGPGDCIAKGQKDYRNGKNSAPSFYMVQPDGSIQSCTKIEAYNASQREETADDLMAEKERLLSRIAEIDRVLNKK